MKTPDKDVIKVIIIDDHRMFNDGLNAMLEPEDDIQVLAQIYDPREARAKIKKLNPDVVLMDFNMPHVDGISLTRLVMSERPDTKILILSMYDDERHIETFREIRAQGYIFKTASAEELISAIRKINSGGDYFPEMSSGNNHSNDTFIKRLNLTSREMEVIQLIKSGMTTKEIAKKLKISYFTAETHRKNIKLKVGLKGEAEFIKFIFES